MVNTHLQLPKLRLGLPPLEVSLYLDDAIQDLLVLLPGQECAYTGLDDRGLVLVQTLLEVTPTKEPSNGRLQQHLIQIKEMFKDKMLQTVLGEHDKMDHTLNGPYKTSTKNSTKHKEQQDAADIKNKLLSRVKGRSVD